MDGDLAPEFGRSISIMTDRLRHRGPDGGAVRRTPWYAFGHRRLAIIDRAGGDQPMANEDGSDLDRLQRRDLQPPRVTPDLEPSGHVFRTHSDTEAILHAYEEFGEPASSDLKGCLRLPSTTSTARRVLLARDRLGKKPLFYATLDGILHFASEIKADQVQPGMERRTRPRGDRGLPFARLLHRADTVYRDVRKLEAQTLCCAGRSARTQSAPTGTSRSSIPTPAAPRVAGRYRRTPVGRSLRAARERSAARRVSLWRNRFRPGRLVHGRSAHRAGGDRDRWFR